MTRPDVNDVAADDQKRFVAKLPNVKPMLSILRTIQFKEKATCHILPEGLRIVVEDSHCVQAVACLQKELFSPYILRSRADDNDEDLELDFVFGFSLNALLECLNIFGSGGGSGGASGPSQPARGGSGSMAGIVKGATIVKLSYDGPGTPLELMLEDSGVVTVCKLVTFEPEPELNLEFENTPAVQRVIMKSELVRSAFDELGSANEKITFLISPQRPFFRLSSSGVTGSNQIDFPKGTDVLESFDCTMTIKNSYRFSHIQQCTKVLNASTRTSIRTNERGFMAMQFMIPAKDTSTSLASFVTFQFSPLESGLGEDQLSENDQ